jgi:hypothetical protein
MQVEAFMCFVFLCAITDALVIPLDLLVSGFKELGKMYMFIIESKTMATIS